MRALTLGFSILTLVALTQAAQAQCGCQSVQHAHYAPRPVVSQPVRAPANVAFVNRLANPVDRGTYVLTYAVHLTDGRILLTDFMPSGHSISGTEHRTGGKKVAARVGQNGRIIVNDPQSNEPIAAF